VFHDHTITADRPSGDHAGTGPFATIDEALAELRAGRMVVVCDDEDRENEGDLTMAAEFATPEAINFMATHGRGLICLSLTGQRCDELGLRQMAEHNEAPLGTAFTVSIEARTGVTTGISAADRAHTIQVAVDPTSDSSDVVVPGHMFPLRARDGGVLERRGQTEAAVDLARLAGLRPAGVICEIMNDDGTMSRVPDLVGFCARHDLKMVTVEALAAYRQEQERRVVRAAETGLPTSRGDYRIVGYETPHSGEEHVALVHGDLGDGHDVPVHVQRADLLVDVFGGGRRDVDAALDWMRAEGRGVLVYLGGDDRLGALQRRGHAPATSRPRPAVDIPDHDLAAQILVDLGVRSARVRSADRLALEELADHGLHAVPAGPRSVASAAVVR